MGKKRKKKQMQPIKDTSRRQFTPEELQDMDIPQLEATALKIEQQMDIIEGEIESIEHQLADPNRGNVDGWRYRARSRERYMRIELEQNERMLEFAGKCIERLREEEAQLQREQEILDTFQQAKEMKAEEGAPSTVKIKVAKGSVEHIEFAALKQQAVCQFFVSLARQAMPKELFDKTMTEAYEAYEEFVELAKEVKQAGGRLSKDR